MPTNKESEDRFTHLAIDTSALCATSWPGESELDDIVHACRRLEIPVLMSDLVLWEAERVWPRRATDAINEARSVFTTARRRTLYSGEAADAWPTASVLRERYVSAIERVKELWNWSSVPLPNVTLEEAVRRAIAHEPPFPATDTGFRDALILWSLLEQLKAGDILGFIAADNDFRTTDAVKRLDQAAAGRGVAIRLFREPKAALSAVEKMLLAGATRERILQWEARNGRLLAALEADRERLQAFVAENLRVPEYALGVADHIVAVHKLRIGRIGHAHVPFAADQQVRASAEVEANLEVTTKHYPTTPPRMMKVGESWDDFSPSIAVTDTVTDIDGTVTVRIDLTWPQPEGAPLRLTYVDAEFLPQAANAMIRSALMQAIKGSSEH